MYVDWDPRHLSLVVCYILHLLQELIMQGMQQNLEKSSFRFKKNTWHVESDYILQPPKCFIIGVHRFRYINNNFT